MVYGEGSDICPQAKNAPKVWPEGISPFVRVQIGDGIGIWSNK